MTQHVLYFWSVDVGSIAGRKQKGLGLFIGSVRRFSSGAGSRRTRRAETRKCRVADTNTLLRFAFAIVCLYLFYFIFLSFRKITPPCFALLYFTFRNSPPPCTNMFGIFSLYLCFTILLHFTLHRS